MSHDIKIKALPYLNTNGLKLLGMHLTHKQRERMHNKLRRFKDLTHFFIPMTCQFNTVMIISFWTDRPVEEQSDQGLHCLPFHLHCSMDSLLYGRAT